MLTDKEFNEFWSDFNNVCEATDRMVKKWESRISDDDTKNFTTEQHQRLKALEDKYPGLR